MTDLLEATAGLVEIPSPSRDEQVLVAHLEQRLAPCPWLEVVRVGDNLVARTGLGRERRVVLAGHTDTVPAHDDQDTRIEGDRLYGLGSADMKGGLAVMLELATTVVEPAVDVTYIFYAREEIDAVESGLGELIAQRPDLVVGDLALVGEPTSAKLEAGCQGTLRVEIVLAGLRAHTARPWMGRNAIHRLAGLVGAIDSAALRSPVIAGCEFRESLQAVGVSGGVAGNVVPDRAELVVNHRFAPDRSVDEAFSYVMEVIGPWIDDSDTVEIVDSAPGAMPALDDEVLASFVERNSLEVVSKLGWTDVARFAELGIPAANFGPGDPLLAHTPDEFLERAPLERVHAALLTLVTRDR